MLTTISAANAVSSALSPPAFAAFWTDLFNRRIVDAIAPPFVCSTGLELWKVPNHRQAQGGATFLLSSILHRPHERRPRVAGGRSSRCGRGQLRRFSRAV